MMRAIRLDAGGGRAGTVRLDAAAPAPVPGPGQALVRPQKVIITATELALVSGDVGPLGGAGVYRGIIGHEFIGTVEQINLPDDPPPLLRDKRSLRGKRVVASPIIVCGACDMCRAGLAMHCRSRSVVGVSGHEGVLAERACLPLGNLHAVPDTVSDEQAVLAWSVVRAAHAAQLARAAAKGFITVLAGDGGGDAMLALLTAQVLALHNRSTRILSTNSWALRACERWGLKHRPLAEAGRRQDQDALIVCSTRPGGLRIAMQMVRPRGTIILASPTLHEPLPPGQPFPDPHGSVSGPAAAGDDALRPLDLNPLLVSEITLIGCRDGPAAASCLGEALALLQPGGGVDVAGLLSRRARLDEAVSAIQSAAETDTPGLVIEL